MVSESSATTTSYCSTRGGAKGVSFEDVVLGGLAEDRGLYVPEELPAVSAEELSEVGSCVCSCMVRAGMVIRGPLQRLGIVSECGSHISVWRRLIMLFYAVQQVQRTRSNQRACTYIRTTLGVADHRFANERGCHDVCCGLQLLRYNNTYNSFFSS